MTQRREQPPGKLWRLFMAQATAAGADPADPFAGLLSSASPSLPIADANDRTVWAAGPGTMDQPTASDILARALQDYDQPWPLLRISAAARVYRDGNREQWEQASAARSQRLSRAAIAAATTAENRWLDQVADGVVLLCEQTSWCWPAHDDTHQRTGAVFPDPARPFLDLGAGEVVAQLTWLDHLLGSWLERRYPGLRARIRHEARIRVFDPFLQRRDWHWLGLDGRAHNWCAWVHGNVLTAALGLLDHPSEAALRAKIVGLAISGLDRYLAALPDDGAIDEGYDYWWNGACRAWEALDLLRHATDGVLDASDLTSLRATIAFPHRMQVGGDWFVNFADASARAITEHPWAVLHRAALATGDQAARAFAASHRVPGAPVASEAGGLGRLMCALTDANWIAATATDPPLPRDSWFGSTQVMLAREHSGSSAGLTLAAKGGHNAEHHNHNDVGSFIVASDGIPVIIDPGRPTYTAATFGEDRYQIWTMQSAWHNVPEVGGQQQHPGRDAAATGVSYQQADEAASLSMRIESAYPGAGLNEWHRSVRLERGQSVSRVHVLDQWGFAADAGSSNDAASDPKPTVLRLILSGEVTLEADRARVVPRGDGGSIDIRWSSGAEPSASALELDDPLLTAVWGTRLTRIDLDVTRLCTCALTIEQVPTGAPGPRTATSP